MAIFQLRTFIDLVNAVQEELKVQNGDTTALNRIKRAINAVYVNEIAPAERWSWLRDTKDLTHSAKTITGTSSVTQNSKTVTLTDAPANSQRGNWFSSQGFQERYKIVQHAAASSTIILQAEYNGATDSAASYALWSDHVALPVDCRETFEITQDFSNEPLTGKGLQEIRTLVNINPRLEGRPIFYSTGDYIDPDPYEVISSLPATATRASSDLVRTITFASDVSSLISEGDRIEITDAGDEDYNQEAVVSSVTSAAITYTAPLSKPETTAVDTGITVKKLSNETITERFRELLLYPSRLDRKVNLHVDYIRHAPAMENDADEPLLPMEHRIVIVYGALQTLWRSIGRNPEEAAISSQLFQAKMAAMRGKVDDSTDTPTLRTSRTYLGNKRHSARRRHPRGFFGHDGVAGGASASIIKGNANELASYDSNGELGSSGTETSELLTDSSTDTLTNKTIDGDDNTLQDLALTTLKTVVADQGKFLVRDTAGVVVSNTQDVPAGDVVGTTDTQTLTNKTIGSTNAVARAAINSGTADNVVINNGSGNLSSEASLAKSRGGTGADNSSVTFPSSGTIDTTTAATTLAAKTLTSPVINTSVSGTAVKDEDNMVSNDSAAICTQQSIKTFVDDSIPTVADSASAGLISFYKKEAISADNDFTGGTFKVERINDMVTITITANMTHSSASTAATSAGLVPSYAQPGETLEFVYFVNATTIRGVSISSGGALTTSYFNTDTGAASSRTSSGTFGISYSIGTS